MGDSRNRPDSKKATNDWLSPPELVQACGPFDFDPCCYPLMPWRTAKVMVSNRTMARDRCILDADSPSYSGWGDRYQHTQCHCYDCLLALGKHPVNLVEDGLKSTWLGRVWLNPPWDDPLPWAERMAAHGNGLMLTSAKSTETKWAQLILGEAQAVLFFKSRLLYHYPSGRKSKGAWTPSMLAAFGKPGNQDGQRNVMSLLLARHKFGGVILDRFHEEQR